MLGEAKSVTLRSLDTVSNVAVGVLIAFGSIFSPLCFTDGKGSDRSLPEGTVGIAHDSAFS